MWVCVLASGALVYFFATSALEVSARRSNGSTSLPGDRPSMLNPAGTVSRPIAPTSPTTRWPAVRAALICGVLGAIAAVARREWRPLPAALASRGLEVVGPVRWLDPPGLSARRALLLAREHNAPTDLYAVTARTGADDRVVSVRDVSNLTRSRDADETQLTTDGPFAAFATRVEDRTVAVNVMDTRGDPTIAPTDRGARVRGSITRWQQTGRARGYGLDRFELVTPRDAIDLVFHGGVVDATAGRELRVRIDPDGPHLLDGAAFVRERLRRAAPSSAWVTWAVDTVRAIPWIGPAPIAWAETVAFRAEHTIARARVATLGDHSQRDVAEDLADVLAGRTQTDVEGRVEAWPPAAIEALVSPRIAHEGEWTLMGGSDDPFVRSNPGAPPPMAITFVRSDSERPDSRVYVAMWDPRQIELHVAPGADEPIGATGETGTGAIPRDEGTMRRVVAGFNGAFQAIHGEYGVFAEGIVLLPPKPYAATVALMADGSTAFGSWPDRDTIPDDMLEYRQNLTALVEGGRFNPWRRTFWGGIVAGSTGGLHTTRSALCLTREQYVAYFWGQVVDPEGLARAMIAARCDYGMHLDMNGQNTGFETYRVDHPNALPPLRRALSRDDEAEGTIHGMEGLSFRARRLVRRMSEPLPRYIRRDVRDFFYLLTRPVLPGAALDPPIDPAQPGEGTWHVAGMGEAAFPWPFARTRVRPDPARPERWVNLVRVDPRRVSFAPPDASEHVLARVVAGTMASPGGLRLSMTAGSAGAQWSIGTAGDGLAGSVLAPRASVLRAAGIDANGFLVIAVADRALPDLVARALDLAGCGSARIAFDGTVLVLANGHGAAGENAPSGAPTTVALIERAFVGGRRIFTEVAPGPPSLWRDLQRRRVRYQFSADHAGTMTVHIAGRQEPLVLPIRGYTPAPADAGAH